MCRQVLVALALVGLFTGSTQVAGMEDAELFGEYQVFDPTQNLLGTRPGNARPVAYVDHCGRAELSFPGKRLIALDNDGVLLPVGSKNPADTQRARYVVAHLAANPHNEVWIVSARSLSGLTGLYSDIPGVNLAAEHGTILLRYGKPEKSVDIQGMEGIRNNVVAIAHRYPQIKMTVFDTKNVVAFKYNKHWYDSADARAALGEVQSILQPLQPRISLRQESGQAYGEIKDSGLEKGNFVAKLLLSGRFRSGIAMGDQITDEGMFRAMNNHRFHSVIVSQNSNQETVAKNRLNDVDEVHELLSRLY